ncbi:MAG: hypothetical protein LQ345_004654, partial [Seirophora villosa]
MADNGKGSECASPIESRGHEYDEPSLSDLLSPDEKRPRRCEVPGGFSDGEKPAIAHVDGVEDSTTDPRPEPPVSLTPRELWRYVDDGEDEENRSSLVEFKEHFEEQYAELERKGMPEVCFFSALDPIMWTEVREEFGTVNWQASSPTRDPSLRPLPENGWETCATAEEDPFTSPERDPFSPEQDPFASPDRLGDKVQCRDVVKEDAGQSAEKDSAEQRMRRTTLSKVKTPGGAASIAGGQSLHKQPPVPEFYVASRTHAGKDHSDSRHSKTSGQISGSRPSGRTDPTGNTSNNEQGLHTPQGPGADQGGSNGEGDRRESSDEDSKRRRKRKSSTSSTDSDDSSSSSSSDKAKPSPKKRPRTFKDAGPKPQGYRTPKRPSPSSGFDSSDEEGCGSRPNKSLKRSGPRPSNNQTSSSPDSAASSLTSNSEGSTHGGAAHGEGQRSAPSSGSNNTSGKTTSPSFSTGRRSPTRSIGNSSPNLSTYEHPLGRNADLNLSGSSRSSAADNDVPASETADDENGNTPRPGRERAPSPPDRADIGQNPTNEGDATAGGATGSNANGDGEDRDDNDGNQNFRHDLPSSSDASDLSPSPPPGRNWPHVFLDGVNPFSNPASRGLLPPVFDSISESESSLPPPGVRSHLARLHRLPANNLVPAYEDSPPAEAGPSSRPEEGGPRRRTPTQPSRPLSQPRNSALVLREDIYEPRFPSNVHARRRRSSANLRTTRRDDSQRPLHLQRESTPPPPPPPPPPATENSPLGRRTPEYDPSQGPLRDGQQIFEDADPNARVRTPTPLSFSDEEGATHEDASPRVLRNRSRNPRRLGPRAPLQDLPLEDESADSSDGGERESTTENAPPGALRNPRLIGPRAPLQDLPLNDESASSSDERETASHHVLRNPHPRLGPRRALLPDLPPEVSPPPPETTPNLPRTELRSLARALDPTPLPLPPAPRTEEEEEEEAVMPPPPRPNPHFLLPRRRSPPSPLPRHETIRAAQAASRDLNAILSPPDHRFPPPPQDQAPFLPAVDRLLRARPAAERPPPPPPTSQHLPLDLHPPRAGDARTGFPPPLQQQTTQHRESPIPSPEAASSPLSSPDTSSPLSSLHPSPTWPATPEGGRRVEVDVEVETWATRGRLRERRRRE